MTKRFPFSGIPQGWYVIATSDEVRPGQVVGRRYFDRELVLYRTESGIVRAVDGHCPHMGAHLEAGRVVGEQLRCAFHGFQFDLDGICVATPYGEGVPPRARLSTWLLREQNGLILTWFDTEGKPPEWTVPELPGHSWNGLVWHRYTDLETHPQETTENSVDFGHFTSIHNFASAEMTRDLVTDGPLLKSSYEIHASLQSVGLRRATVRAEFDVEVWGLGYSLVKVSVPVLGVRCRLFVLPTPIDEEHIDLRLACTGTHRFASLGWLFRNLIFRGFRQEVEEDIPVWRRKAYVDPPALAPGDGPVAAYRRWARQFYPAPPNSEPDSQHTRDGGPSSRVTGPPPSE